MGSEIEDPFGTDFNDLPLDQMCQRNREHVLEIVQYSEMFEEETALARERAREADLLKGEVVGVTPSGKKIRRIRRRRSDVASPGGSIVRRMSSAKGIAFRQHYPVGSSSASYSRDYSSRDRSDSDDESDASVVSSYVESDSTASLSDLSSSVGARVMSASLF